MLAALLLAFPLALVGGPIDAPEDGVRFDPPPLELGADLREDWDDLWRRFQDRNGRPDPQGPLLQPSPELQRSEFELTRAVADHPLPLERDWALRTRGARLWINSNDEFSFFNELRIKERIPMGKVGALGIRFDRAEYAGIHSSMLRLDFAFPDIAGSGAFIEVRPTARFEKTDLDLELIVGWQRARLARVSARAFFFDPFNNASDGLAQARDAELELRVVQRNLSAGVSTELELFITPALRAELFFGGVVPSRRTLEYADEAEVDLARTQSALLGGAWIEWALPWAPVWVGASGTLVGTRQVDENFDGAVLDIVPERELRARAYVLAHLFEGTRGELTVELSGTHRRTRLPRHESAQGSATRDHSWLALLRATWMPTRMFGLELTYLTLDRRAEGTGDLPIRLSETNHRLSTRFAFAFNPHVRLTFGVGWDLDGRDGPYDQGGMTLTARW